MKYTIIVPCYNEEENIPDLIDALDRTSREIGIEWVLVENGSTDKTRIVLEHECAEKNNFKIVYVDINQGYGFGIQKGIEASNGDYIGWIHADMQISPHYVIDFIGIIESSSGNERVFMKGKRVNRSILDLFFTHSMTVFSSVLFGTYLYDIGAVPVLFHRDLLAVMDKIPYDFSIDTYVYYKAKKAGCLIRKPVVNVVKREKGQSSWNKGILSRLKQSKVIVIDLIKIRLGRHIK